MHVQVTQDEIIQRQLRGASESSHRKHLAYQIERVALTGCTIPPQSGTGTSVGPNAFRGCASSGGICLDLEVPQDLAFVVLNNLLRGLTSGCGWIWPIRCADISVYNSGHLSVAFSVRCSCREAGCLLIYYTIKIFLGGAKM